MTSFRLTCRIFARVANTQRTRPVGRMASLPGEKLGVEIFYNAPQLPLIFGNKVGLKFKKNFLKILRPSPCFGCNKPTLSCWFLHQ